MLNTQLFCLSIYCWQVRPLLLPGMHLCTMQLQVNLCDLPDSYAALKRNITNALKPYTVSSRSAVGKIYVLTQLHNNTVL